jgi:ribosome-associated protein
LKLKPEKIEKVKKSDIERDLELKEKKPLAKKKVTPKSERKKIVAEIVAEMNNRKCEDIVVLDLEKVNSYLSVFIICTVSSSVQAKSVAREIERKTKHLKLGTGNIEKKNSPSESGWSILDLGEFIIHIMTKEVRSYYDLDKLWGDAERIKI